MANEIEYELHEWSAEARVMLEQLLEGDGIPRAWEGTDLVVPAAFEEQVEALLRHVEASTERVLDPDAPKVLYELADWSEADVTSLAAALDELTIAYEFDIEGNLVVLEVDEERVDDLLDSIESPDALKPDTGDDAVDTADDVDMADLLGELFVAADRLRHDAQDHEGVLGLVGRAELVARLGVPFGFAPAVWHDIQGQVARLATALEDDSADDDEIEAHADELRTLLRNYV